MPADATTSGRAAKSSVLATLPSSGLASAVATRPASQSGAATVSLFSGTIQRTAGSASARRKARLFAAAKPALVGLVSRRSGGRQAPAGAASSGQSPAAARASRAREPSVDPLSTTQTAKSR